MRNRFFAGLCGVLLVALGAGRSLAAGSDAGADARASIVPARQAVLRVTPVPGKAAPRRFDLAEEYGKVCRNGRYVCKGAGSGPVGYSCCGCGFCGWWSAD